jgi:hypothetical protein
VKPEGSAGDATDPDDEFLRFLVDDRVLTALDGLPRGLRSRVLDILEEGS